MRVALDYLGTHYEDLHPGDLISITGGRYITVTEDMLNYDGTLRNDFCISDRITNNEKGRQVMTDSYTGCCDKVERIQEDIDDISSYIEKFEKLKNSKFIKQGQEVLEVDSIITTLKAQKNELETCYDDAYKDLLEEADEVIATYNY